MKSQNLVIISILALSLSFGLKAKALLQSDIFLFNSGGSSNNGLRVDSAGASQGFTILNGQRNQSPNGTFGGGLMLVDPTTTINRRRFIVNNGGVLNQMDNNGNLLRILLSSDLASYDPQVLSRPLTGFVANTTAGTITPATTVLQAFQILAGNQNLGVGAGTASSRLLEANGKILSSASPLASFRANASSGTAQFAKLANYNPDIVIKLQTGVANQIQIISGANTSTINAGSANVPIPGTNLQIDSFNGTQIVFEKINNTGINALNSEIVLHYFGQ